MSLESEVTKRWFLRQTLFNLVVGAGIWFAVSALLIANWSVSSQIHLLILLGVAILVPLALYTTTPYHRDGSLSRLVKLAARFQPLVVTLTGIALLLPAGWQAGVLATGWLIQTVLLFVIGLTRWLPRPALYLEEICIDVGFLYTSISGIWFIFYRASGTFLGFSGLLVPLTVAHFTFIGLGALVVAGMIGRQLRLKNPTLITGYRISAWAVMISPMLVAIGIAHTARIGTVSVIEISGVILLASSYILLAGLYLLIVRPTITQRVARRVLTLSASTLLLTMALALGYSMGRLTNWWLLAIPDMVRWHGWFNAIGFVGLGLVGWSLVRVPAHGNLPGIPFSRLPWRWHIGPDFFARIESVDVMKQPPAGIVDDLTDYASSDCAIEHLAPAIRAFYERIADHHLLVHPEWKPLFRLPARLYKWFSRRVNQMNLPLMPERDESLIQSAIVPLNDVLDGRERVRGWVRTYAHTGEAVYVAAYSSHKFAGRRYMNIAFPLPGGHLTSVLRLETRRENDVTILHLTSINTATTPGDQGVFFVTRWLPVRLPINETIEVSQLPYPGFQESEHREIHHCSFARHRMWLLGIHFLTLHYMLWQPTTDTL